MAEAHLDTVNLILVVGWVKVAIVDYNCNRITLSEVSVACLVGKRRAMKCNNSCRQSPGCVMLLLIIQHPVLLLQPRTAVNRKNGQLSYPLVAQATCIQDWILR